MLENLIADYTGKEMEVHLQVAGNERELEENYYDLRQGMQSINMEIVEEE